MKKVLALTTIFLLLSASMVFAQGEPCQGDFDFDGDVDATDVTTFLQHFGRNQYNDPCLPSGPAPVPKTGQTTSYATGDDGDLEKGVAWPNPRFADNGNGTVTDNLTGLIWLKNANCFETRTWAQALSDCNGLSAGYCGLTDGSIIGDWRLPNKRELFSLIDDSYYGPALSNTSGTGHWSAGNPFNNLQFSDYYWTSTAYAETTAYIWRVGMNFGLVDIVNWFNEGTYVWPVRGGQ